MLRFRTGSASAISVYPLCLGAPDESSTPVFLQMEVVSVCLWVELYIEREPSISEPGTSCEAVCSAESPKSQSRGSQLCPWGVYST